MKSFKELTEGESKALMEMRGVMAHIGVVETNIEKEGLDKNLALDKAWKKMMPEMKNVLKVLKMVSK